MKRVFALILAGLLVGSMTTAAFAQNAGPRPGGQAQSGRRGGGIGRFDIVPIHNRVVAGLGLTAQQKTAVAAADKKRKTAMDAHMKSMQGKDFSKMSQAERKKFSDANTKIRTTWEAELKKAMGAKYATYQSKMQAEIQKEMAKMGGGSMRVDMTAVHKRVIAGLGLTAAQKSGVAAADKKYADSVAALRKQMQGKNFRTMSEAERKKMQDGMNKAMTTYRAALKKAMGDKKYAEYDKKLQAELKKEADKTRAAGRGGNPPKPGGRGA